MERAEQPGDDLSSLLMQAEIDGERLNPFEFAAFVILLSIAGNETTRNAISWGMHLLTEPPDRLQSNFFNGIKRMPCEFTVACRPGSCR